MLVIECYENKDRPGRPCKTNHIVLICRSQAHGAIMRRKNIPAAATTLAAVAITSQFVLDCVEDFGGVLQGSLVEKLHDGVTGVGSSELGNEQDSMPVGRQGTVVSELYF